MGGGCVNEWAGVGDSENYGALSPLGSLGATPRDPKAITGNLELHQGSNGYPRVPRPTPGMRGLPLGSEIYPRDSGLPQGCKMYYRDMDSRPTLQVIGQSCIHPINRN